MDDKPSYSFEPGPMELDFFDRNDGLAELVLMAVSFLYPTPLFEHDPEVTARIAVRAIADECLWAMDRP